MLNVAQNVRQILERLPKGLPIEAKDSFIALSLARSLSLTLNLPTSPVANITTFYATTHNNAVCEVVSAFNEHYIIDAKMTCDLVFRFYKLRYQLAFEPMAIAGLFARIASVSDDLLPKAMLDNDCNYGSTEAQDAFNSLMWEFKKEFSEGSSTAVLGKEVAAPTPTMPV